VKAFSGQTHYELLEISVGATTDEVRYAYSRLVKLYADEQLALYGLVSEDDARTLRLRLKAAHDVLCDGVLRSEYDLKIGLPPQDPPVPRLAPAELSEPVRFLNVESSSSDVLPAPTFSPPIDMVMDAPAPAPFPGTPPPLEEPRVEAQVAIPPVDAVSQVDPPALEEPPVEVPLEDHENGVGAVSALVPRPTPHRGLRSGPRHSGPAVGDDAEFNGELLKQVRMGQGLSLIQLSERTRIGQRHLENIENDRYELLPASVYLRGYLMNLARELGLDGLKVCRSYLAFVSANRSKG
jgi:hypothetical protein